jgi:hypothetical protein
LKTLPFQDKIEMKNSIMSTFLIVSMVAAPAVIIAKSEPPEVSLEGLELVEKDRRGELYADPDIDWSVYDKVQLDKATVAFRRNWQRDQNHSRPFNVKAADMEKIKADLSELFDQVFTEELTGNGGYEITDEGGDNVMRITPRIIDLDVHAPDTPSAGITRSYVESAGKMTLKLEIYDSVTGDLIVTASDRQEAYRYADLRLTRATSVSNSAEARRMIKRWATALLKRLDEAQSSPG